MVLGCILPIAWHQGQMYFLFGKECALENSAPGWSDFGGGCENCSASDTVAVRKHKVLLTAVREGVEESTGFLGTQESIMAALRRATSIANRLRKQYTDTKYSEYECIERNSFTTYFMPIQYDANLPVYYNRNHAMLWANMDRAYLNKTKLFEKSEIGWFSESDLRRRRNEFRYFYRDIVDLILLRASTPYFRRFAMQLCAEPKINKSCKSKSCKSKRSKNKTKKLVKH